MSRVCSSVFSSYLKLNLGLGDVLLATTTAGDLLSLGELGTDSL